MSQTVAGRVQTSTGKLGSLLDAGGVLRRGCLGGNGDAGTQGGWSWGSVHFGSIGTIQTGTRDIPAGIS